MKVKKFTLLMTVLFFLSVFTYPNNSYVHAASVQQMSCSPNRGLDIAFVLDNSGSMTVNDPDNVRVDAAVDLLGDLHEYDRGAVIKFNTEATNLQSLTFDRQLIESALKSHSPNGGTDMSTGIHLAIDELTKSSSNNHKIMVVLSDGVSINNTTSLQLAQQANEENIIIYTVGLGNETAIDRSLLNNIATTTGGNFYRAVNANDLLNVFQQIRLSIEDLRQPKIFSDWTLTEDLHMEGDLVLTENMKLDLNGYNLIVDGSLVLLSCSELRAVSGNITTGQVEQKAGSTINLNNSQLVTTHDFTQDGSLRVNGDYSSDTEEITIGGKFTQNVHGNLDLNGFMMTVEGPFIQEGTIAAGGGSIIAKENVTQKGFFDLEEGKLLISGNLIINGGLLIDNDFQKNKSLNVNGGYVQVGSKESMAVARDTGNVIQNSGQLYVNGGIIDIFGDYTITNGWLTMIHGTQDPTTSSGMDRAGDYVHVYRNFTMESPRNHGERLYNHLGKPMNDQAHLTDGILQVDGNFKQLGNELSHLSYSDRSQKYEKDYSRFNFDAEGRHKVLLTGKGDIEMQGSGSHFNTLELQGKLIDYNLSGQVKWNQLIESKKSTKARLKSLTIQGIPVHGFKPDTLDYQHSIPFEHLTGPLLKLKVDAIAEDHRNATVEVAGNTIGVDGTAQVRILVTASDGKTTELYTVNVRVSGAQPGVVTGLSLDQTELLFIHEGPGRITPNKGTIKYTVLPTNAENQKVSWRSTNNSVATVYNGIVTPHSIGEATIIAQTEDGGFTQSVNVKVKPSEDLFQGIRTLANFVEDPTRYNKIMALYDPDKIGIVVPGKYIEKMTFNSIGHFTNGKIKTNPTVGRVEVRVNDIQLPTPNLGVLSNEFLFNRSGLRFGDYIEIIAYNSAGDELERVATLYPRDYFPNNSISPGRYSIRELLEDPMLFNQILDIYPLEELRFEVRR